MQLSCQKDWIIFLILGWGKSAAIPLIAGPYARCSNCPRRRPRPRNRRRNNGVEHGDEYEVEYETKDEGNQHPATLV
jgi:hypothetical protein